MADSCVEITSISEAVFLWLKNQLNVGEESITDWSLYEISQRIKNSGYVKFNRHEEARKTGADWEWWFIGNRRSLRLRIQAKKLQNKADVYPALAYTNKYGLQIEKLLNNAAAVNAIPLYAFYLAPDSNPTVLCRGKANSGKNDGIFISEAKLLFGKYIAKGRATVSALDLLKSCNPLSCLFCCPQAQGDDKVTSIRNYIKSYFSSDTQGQISRDNDIEGLHENKELPNYVSYLLQHMREPVQEWWDQEFQRWIVDFDAVQVIDLRDQKE